MAEEATAVSEQEVQQDTPATESAPVENNSPEVADPLLDILSSDEDKATEPEAETESEAETPVEEQNESQADETQAEEQPQGEEKPLSEKAENRFQKLANENRELKAYIEQLHAQVYQPQTAEELMDEGLSPELAEVRALKQQLEVQSYNNRVIEAISSLESESARVLHDFPIFDPTSPDYQEDLALAASESLQASLIRDPNTGQIIGSHLSPQQIYKPIADAYEKSRVKGQIQGQKATEKMLASVDSRGSVTPKQPKKDPLMEILTSDD